MVVASLQMSLIEDSMHNACDKMSAGLECVGKRIDYRCALRCVSKPMLLRYPARVSSVDWSLCTVISAVAEMTSGEAVCQKQGQGGGTREEEFTQIECENVGCCQWAPNNDGKCWSSVGTESCDMTATSELKDELPKKEDIYGDCMCVSILRNVC